MRLQNKVAIVTGAASGFGEGIAKRFAKEGAQVLVADINLDGAENVRSGPQEFNGVGKWGRPRNWCSLRFNLILNIFFLR